MTPLDKLIVGTDEHSAAVAGLHAAYAFYWRERSLDPAEPLRMRCAHWANLNLDNYFQMLEASGLEEKR